MLFKGEIRMEDKQFKELMVKLDKLTRIIALSSTQGLTVTERIYLLHNAKFSPTEIAEIVGTSTNVVNVRLSELRKKARDKNGK